MTAATKPTNVLLGPERQTTAKRLARERGISLSAFLRELIDDAAAESSATRGDISCLIGLFGDDPDHVDIDIGRDKHKLISEAFVDASPLKDRW